MIGKEMTVVLTRLEQAVERLEVAADGGAGQFKRLRSDNAALRDTTLTVSKRLDAVTSRLKVFAGD